MTTHVARLREKMAEEELDGVLISQPQNRRYISGFTGSAGYLIVSEEKQILAADFRYYEQVRQQCPDWELFEAGSDFIGKMLELLREAGLGGRRVGFEAGHVSVATLHAWERALEGRLVLVNTQGFVETLRMQKDDEEVSRIKKAVELADAAWDHVVNWVEPGMTELQVAWELESYMRTHGASAMSFDPIVASGPNSAKPHAEPTDRVLQKGEPITMDFGCVVEGYCSDITRTICLDEPADDQYQVVWNIVLQAHETAKQAARAGMTGEAIDQLARDIISEADYGDNFGHGLGHGVGLAIHEGPRFSPLYPDEIQAGAVVTVEPGIYIPDWGGVRLEDMVVVRDDGVDVLTRAPKEAIINLD